MNAPVVDMPFEELLARARSLISPGERRILGISGAPGAGKSTIALRLSEALGEETAQFVPMDGFHLANEILVENGHRESKGAHYTFDSNGYAHLLQRIYAQKATGEPVIYAPEYRRETSAAIAGAIAVRVATPLVITEGNYILLENDAWPVARQYIDEVWFVAVDEQVRIDRLIKRHIAFGKSEAEAKSWSLGTDQDNARLILDTARAADLVVRVT